MAGYELEIAIVDSNSMFDGDITWILYMGRNQGNEMDAEVGLHLWKMK